MQASASRFTGVARVGRAMTLGTAVVLLTVMGHTAGGGWSGHDTASLVLLWPLAVVLSLVAADRRRSAAWLFVFAIGVQAFLHGLLAIAAGHGADAGPFVPSPVMMTGHLVAAAATALMLAQGDRLLQAWLDFWHMLARGGVRIPTHSCVRAPEQVAYAAPPVSDPVICGAISRRGPPAFAA